jgi:hypothetical protein
MPESNNEKRRWYDEADLDAWPTAVAVFVVTAILLALAGLGLASLLAALALGFAALNVRAARARRRPHERT